MKESVLIIKSEDGFDKKVNVKLTEDHILIKELSNLSHCSPLSSTAIGSPVFNDSYKSSGVFAHQVKIYCLENLFETEKCTWKTKTEEYLHGLA